MDTGEQQRLPRFIADKCYEVLKDAGQPLHYATITERINERYSCDYGKISVNVTLNNEIKRRPEPRFVRIKTGVYGL